MPIEADNLIKVLVVDDSAFMRKVISDILNSDEKIKVVGTAKNGAEAIEKVCGLNPDIITLDVEMPVMDGLTCLEKLTEICDIPVLMLSSLTHEGSAATIKALERGAIDFVAKPTNIFNMASNEKKVELIGKVKFIANLRYKVKKSKAEEEGRETIKKSSRLAKSDKKSQKEEEVKKIVAIGVSTGGPKALREVIPLLPADFPAAVLVVQHMLPGFTKSLAERLDSISEIEVKEAEDGEIIRAGYVYIAPGDYHMRVKFDEDGKLGIKLSDEVPVGGHRPSIDIMMESLSDTRLSNITAVIMTGMGGDGSEGVKKIKNINNGYIIAQDEKSCIVFGMPKVAIDTGVVDTVVSLDGIAKEIRRIVGV